MIQILKDKQSMYTINTSLHELPVVISLPHSGTYITSEMAENLMDDVIFPNTDWYLPKLYGFLKELGFTKMCIRDRICTLNIGCLSGFKNIYLS